MKPRAGQPQRWRGRAGPSRAGAQRHDDGRTAAAARTSWAPPLFPARWGGLPGPEPRRRRPGRGPWAPHLPYRRRHASPGPSGTRRGDNTSGCWEQINHASQVRWDSARPDAHHATTDLPRRIACGDFGVLRQKLRQPSNYLIVSPARPTRKAVAVMPFASVNR